MSAVLSKRTRVGDIEEMFELRIHCILFPMQHLCRISGVPIVCIL